MSELEIFSFPYGAYIKLRLEFVLLRDDDLQARIMRIIEGWMIDQKKVWENAVAEAASQGVPEPEEPEYWCTLSYAQIIAQLYKFNTSRGSGKKDKPNGKEVIEGKNNTITRVTVANAMHALIEDHYVLVRANPNAAKEYEASQYSLNIPLIQEHLAHLPKKPMSYLGSNGRINGIPCKDFLHPPENLNSELGHDPRKKSLHPTQNNFTSHVNETHMGDVKKSYNLIDNVVIDLSLDKTIEVDVASLNNQETNTTTTTNLSLSEQLENHEPEEKPTEPDHQLLEAMPWGAKKALRISEKLTKIKYDSQQIELNACKKILDTYKPTEQEYEDAFQKLLKWYQENKRLLCPVDLLSSNKKTGKIRFAELLQEVRHQQTRTSAPEPAKTQTTTGMSQAEAMQLALDIEDQAHDKGINITAHAKDNQTQWVVKVSWGTQRMPLIFSRSFWDEMFLQMTLEGVH